MKLYSRQLGKGEPLLILHGLFGISDNWLSIAKQLARSHHCYILDMRNHGRSPHSPDLSYDDMVEDIYEFLTDFGLRKVSLLGHSMGGMTAMNFAFEYPHRLNKLVVVDIAPKSYPVLHQDIIRGLASIPVHKIKTRREADDLLKEYVSSFKIRQFLLKNLQYQEDQTYAWRINLDAIQGHASDIGRGISGDYHFDQPTLFIRGSESNYILEEDVPRIKDLFSDVSIVTIPGASHWVHAEKPEEFIAALQTFL